MSGRSRKTTEVDSHRILTQQRRFSTTEETVEGRKTHGQATTEGGCRKGLAKNVQGGNSESADVNGLQTKSLHLDHIWTVLFQIYCSVWRHNDKTLLDLSVRH